MMDKQNDPIIKLINISKWYKDFQVLKDINLEVQRNEVFVIMGPSGSGKSTLLKVITGLEDVQTGDVVIDNEHYNCKNHKMLSGRKRAKVGMVFQQFNLYPHMTALENLTIALRKVKKKTRKEAEEISLPILQKMSLENKRHSYPSQLSGGEQQRVAIARCLVMEPKIILFDEPTSALDVELTHEVLNTIAQLSMSGMTMVIVTHELGFALRVSNRIAFFDAGEIVEINKPQEMIENPKMERTKAFMNKFFMQI